MYICSECGLKFKNKVDYCDCGNDTFEYIADKTEMTVEQKAELISRLFFLICMILAILVWFIPIGTTAPTEIKKQETVKKNIPDINKIWDDTPPYQAPAPIKQEPEVTTLSDLLEPLPPKKIKPQPKIEPKVSSQTKPQPKTQPVQQKVQPVTEPSKVVPQQDIKKTETKQKADLPKQEPKKPVYNPNSPEMIRYKTNLRAALFSRFAVGSIQGSGSCEIQFSVDPTGKLINRRFNRESENKTLNDTVYYMLMSVPRFSAPPSGYNGEPIKMNFSINNGNYEISIY